MKPLANGENPRREGHRPWNTAAAVQLSSNYDRIALRLNREATPCDMAPNTRDTKTASALYRPQPPAGKHRDARLENTASGDTNHRLEMICDESQQLDGARLFAPVVDDLIAYFLGYPLVSQGAPSALYVPAGAEH